MDKEKKNSLLLFNAPILSNTTVYIFSFFIVILLKGDDFLENYLLSSFACISLALQLTLVWLPISPHQVQLTHVNPCLKLHALSVVSVTIHSSIQSLTITY